MTESSNFTSVPEHVMIRPAGEEAARMRINALYDDLLERCTNKPRDGVEPIHCDVAKKFYRPWLTGMCENQRDGKPYATVHAHGCSLTCNCCGGGRCHEVCVPRTFEARSTHRQRNRHCRESNADLALGGRTMCESRIHTCDSPSRRLNLSVGWPAAAVFHVGPAWGRRCW